MSLNDDITGLIDEMIRYNDNLNSELSYESLGDQLNAVRAKVVRLQDELKLEAYRNRGVPVWKSQKESR